MTRRSTFLLMLLSVAFAQLLSSLMCAGPCRAAPPPVKQFEDLRAVMLKRRGKDLSSMDLRACDLLRNTFDTFTPWPSRDMLPKGFDAGRVLEWGKRPGLGVRELHRRGVTGDQSVATLAGGSIDE